MSYYFNHNLIINFSINFVFFIVASKSPFGFTVVNLYHMHEIPLSWNPVPEGFLNGILIGESFYMFFLSVNYFTSNYFNFQHLHQGPQGER